MDYAKSFSPVGFSDAESSMAISDAQNVSYGFNLNPAAIVPGRIAGANNGTANAEKNALPETRVSDFGSVWYPFGATGKKPKIREIPVAAKLAKGGASGARAGVVAGGGTVGNTARPAEAMARITGAGIDKQNEAARRIIYFGQLGG
jgi:hypothetical protein